MPVNLKGWLCEGRSLTRRLKRYCTEPFSLEVISQGWERPLEDERRALQLRLGRLALVRQVRLLCGKRPLIFARSVIPILTLRGASQRLSRLGSRPLADLLFTDQKVRRGDMEFTLIRPGSTLHGLTSQALGIQAAEFWGRRSLFRFKHKPLLVSEMFSPELPLVSG